MTSMRQKFYAQYDEIGEVSFQRHPRAKYLSIKIQPFSPVRVVVPMHATMKQADSFLKKNIDWVKKKRQSAEKEEKKRTVFDENTSFRTRGHRLKIGAKKTDKISIKIYNGVIQIWYPNDMAVRHPDIQSAIRHALVEAWRIEAKELIPQRVTYYAQKHGFSFQRIFIKNIKSRWGSCSAQNNLNFSLHLMRLPDHLIDYVVLHELCHTIEKNHSKNYWNLLESICPKAKQFRKELRDYHCDVF